MFAAFFNSFKIPELRKRIVFTLAMLAICRIGSWIPIPGIDPQALSDFLAQQSQSQGSGSLLGMYDLFVGGALYRGAVAALGIMPYISASIVMQLATAFVPTLARMAREGDVGRAKITQYSRYLAVGLCLVQGAMTTQFFMNPQSLLQGFQGAIVVNPGWGFTLTAILTMTATSMLLMWIGEQISARGIGNGVSLVITIGIVGDLPSAVFLGFEMARAGQIKLPIFVMMLGMAVAVIAGIIAVTQAQRKIPIQHAKRIVGQKMMTGGQSFMPLRINYSGVMPIIFAQAILMFPVQIFSMVPDSFFLADEMRRWANALSRGSTWYYVVNTTLIFAFSYFWVAVQFHPVQIADDLKKYGGYIPGIRPGQPTADFLHNTMNRITLAGAVFLVVIALIPDWLYMSQGLNQNISQFFGGTSMLIAVGVMLDTMRQIESQLLMRHYDGFLKKGRLRGRVGFGTREAARGGVLSDVLTQRILIAFGVISLIALAAVVWALLMR